MREQSSGTFYYRDFCNERLVPLSEPIQEGNGYRQSKLLGDLERLTNSFPLQAISLYKQSGSGDLFDLVSLLADMLLSDLSHPEEGRRAEAARAIVLLGKQAPSEILEALERSMFDAARPVREAASEVMREVGTKSQKTSLLLAMEDPEWTVRVSVVQALGTLGKDAPVGALVRALGDEDESVQVAAVWALVGLGMEVLAKPLEDSDEMVGWMSRELSKQTPLRALREVLLENEDEIVRLSVVEALGKLGEQAPHELIVLALRDKDELVRAAAAKALGGLGARTFIELLVFKLKDEDEIVRSETAAALGRLSEQVYTQLSREFLLHLLKDEIEDVQVLAAWALGERGEQASLEPLALALKGSSEKVGLVVSWALEQIHERSALAVRELTSEEVCDSESEVSQELGMLGMQNSAGNLLMCLIDFLQDKKGFVTAEAFNEGVLVLSCCFQSDEQSIHDIVSGLQGRVMQVERLEDALSDEDEAVRGVAVKVVKKLVKRSWAETLMLSLDLRGDEEVLDQGLPTKVVVFFISYAQVRANDVSVSQSVDVCFGEGRYRLLDERVNTWMDRWESQVSHSSLCLQKVKLWYGSAAPSQFTGALLNSAYQKDGGHAILYERRSPCFSEG